MSLITFNSEQKLIENEIRKFAKVELEPVSDEIDKKGVFPVEVIKKLSDLGLSSLIIPEAYGGADLDATSLCIVLSELSKVCASVSTILLVNNCLVAFPLIKFAPEEIKKSYLKKLAQGTIGACSTELGIDLPEKSVKVKEADGKVSISGEQSFVLNGESARFVVLSIPLSAGKVLCVVDNDPSIQVMKHHILGLRAAGIVGYKFRDLRIRADTCLLDGHQTEDALFQIRNYAHIGFSAISLGIAEAAYDASVKYSKERKQFGKAICEFPMIQELLIDMKTKIEAARLLVYNAAAECDKGHSYTLSANIARLHSGEAAIFAGIKAVQVHGGYGYTKDYPVERFLRDAKAIQVLCETPNDVKSLIVKEILT